MPKVTLQTFNLATGYRRQIVADDISITLHSGEVCAMLGSNGAGKSTLLKTLTKEIPLLRGKAELLGIPLRDYTPRRMAKTVALVATGATQAGALTVSRLVALGRHPHTGLFGRLSEDDRRIAFNAMERAGIAHKADAFVATLSDGERQKAMIARALAQQTPIILLDEPFSFLDVASRVEILDVLKNEAAERDTTILFSSHDVAQSLRMADSLVIFRNDGSVVQGSPSEMVRTGVVGSMFEGRDVVFDPVQNDFVACKSAIR